MAASPNEDEAKSKEQFFALLRGIVQANYCSWGLVEEACECLPYGQPNGQPNAEARCVWHSQPGCQWCFRCGSQDRCSCPDGCGISLAEAIQLKWVPAGPAPPAATKTNDAKATRRPCARCPPPRAATAGKDDRNRAEFRVLNGQRLSIHLCADCLADSLADDVFVEAVRA